ncbi:MarR family transcriptional regulator [Microbacterium lushaniae]|nr:MarR family transcriptional regulator [Microbacterium lushaniae]
MTEAGGFVYVIKQLELALRPRLEAACAEAGMTAAQFTALTVLRRRPGTTSSDLARRSFVRAQTMAGTLEPLIEQGLVRREPDPQHRRRIRLFLTDAGVQAIDRLEPRVVELEQTLLTDLDEHERALFAEYLRRARHAMRDEHR